MDREITQRSCGTEVVSTPPRRARFVAAETAVALFRGAPAIDAERLRADLDAVTAHEADRRP